MRKIQKFILIFSVLFIRAYALDSHKTDIYFSNGIWVPETKYTRGGELTYSAEFSRQKLQDKLRTTTIHDEANNTDVKALDKAYVDHDGVILQYNFNKGPASDLLESYYQLKKTGQIDRLGFFGWVGELMLDTVWDISSIGDVILPSEETIEKWEKKNVDKMIELYKKESVNDHNGDNILLFSHSQGNLFANRLYDEYFSKLPEYDAQRFQNIQIATPADYVHPRKHDYVTNDGDMITWIPGSLDANIRGCGKTSLGHDFVKEYLECDQIYQRITTSMERFANNKNGLCETCGDLPTGCSYNPNAKHFDVMLVLMTLLSFLYPLYHSGLWIRRRYR
jgi:hypothetical protein